MRTNVRIVIVAKNIAKSLLASFAGVCLILSTFGLTADARTKHWSGLGNDYDWSTNANWNGAFGAGPNDDLIFDDEICSAFRCVTTFRRSLSTNDFPANTSFNSFTFSGPAYHILGNQVVLQNGLVVNRVETDFDPGIVLGARQTWEIDQGDFAHNGVLNLNGHILSVDGGDITLNGTITGDGDLAKSGSGKLTINGDADNIDFTTLNGGTLELHGSLGNVDLNGGTLQGTGIINGVVFGDGGTISPGNGLGSRGTLTIIGRTFLERDGEMTLDIDLEVTANGPVCDRVRVLNDFFTIGGVDLNVSFTTPPSPGQIFVILQQSGPGDIVGQFEQGTAFVKDNQLFFITYFPDRVVLTAQGPVGP